jgi:hypothetical protein
MQIEPTLEQSRGQLSSDVSRQRAITQTTAHQMVLLAARQWEQAARGLLAVPSAIAMTTAAGAMFVTSIVERSFELVEMATIEVGKRAGGDHDALGNVRASGRIEADRRNDAS